MTRSGTVGTVDGLVLSEKGRAFAADRHLSGQTLAKLGVVSGTAFFPELERKAEALIFPYGKGWKARAIEDKAFVASKGWQVSFWNLERVLRTASMGEYPVYVVEGEIDALSLIEAGISEHCILSVPSGARERKENEDVTTVRGYTYVAEALKAGLNKVKKFVWCGDSDGPGLALRQDMARLLGQGRFWFVDWPEGCKDANDLLCSDGRDAVHDMVLDGALPWPVQGVYRLRDLPDPPPLTTWSPGFPQWESKVMLAPRTLSVVTGHPGHGKTQLMGQIWYQVAKAYDLTICTASFETRPKPHLRRLLRSSYCGKREVEMSAEEKTRADDWINAHYLFVVHPEQRPTLEWFLDMAEVAVIRDGAKVVQADPWNRMEAARTRDENETEYIGRCLRTLYVFANDMNCHVQVVAHPAKSDRMHRKHPPELEDIAGSKHWDNMPDQGFVVHRPEMFGTDGSRKTEAVLFHRKARIEELGYPCRLKLNFDLAHGRYVSTDYDGF
jgi:twinkle protein